MKPSFLEQHPLWRTHHIDTTLPPPDVIQLELTAACDLRCVMCPLPHERRHGSGTERFSVADLERERAFFAAASGVELTGFGEILCHPELLACLRWFRGLGLAIQATTNGQRLTCELTEALVAENLLDVLCVSVDSINSSTYHRIRGGDLTRLQRNLERLAVLRAGHPLQFYMSFTAMEPNIRELPDFIRWAIGLGADRVIVQHVFEAAHTTGCGLQHHLDLARDKLTEAAAVADEAGLVLDGRNLHRHGIAGQQPHMVKDCPFPWNHLFLKANRRVAACAMVWEDLDFGHMSAGLGNVWRGENFMRFREAMAGFEPPAPCVRCQYFGWRQATPMEQLSPRLSMDPTQRGVLGWGWHAPERDGNNRFFRWSNAHSVAFLRPTGPMLEIDALTHEQAPFLSGQIRVGDQRFAFDSHDFWGQPLRLPVGVLNEPVVPVELILDETWNPHGTLGIPGPRKLGLLIYGLHFTGDPTLFEPHVDAADSHAQLGRGWLAVEQVLDRPARWTRERADLLLRADEGALAVDAFLPRGLAGRTLRVSCAGQLVGEHPVPADGRWHKLHFPGVPQSPDLCVVELEIEGSAPAPGDRSPHPRQFGILVARVGFEATAARRAIH